MFDEDRRRDERFPTHHEGLLCNLTRKGNTEMAIVEDLSSGGCFVQSTQELWTGDAVTLSVDGEIFLGEIVHARQENHKWLAGVQFEQRINETDLKRLLSEYAATW
jgi:hypothetical protein